jgi:hypothetical protein
MAQTGFGQKSKPLETAKSRPDTETVPEKEKWDADFPVVLQQLSKGCGKQTCANKTACISANQSLQSENKTAAIHLTLKVLRANNYTKCV